jgi:hypothetical protein
MLVDKIIIERHPSKIDKEAGAYYLIRAIPYQDSQQEVERLKAPDQRRRSRAGEPAGRACRLFDPLGCP